MHGAAPEGRSNRHHRHQRHHGRRRRRLLLLLLRRVRRGVATAVPDRKQSEAEEYGVHEAQQGRGYTTVRSTASMKQSTNCCGVVGSAAWSTDATRDAAVASWRRCTCAASARERSATA